MLCLFAAGVPTGITFSGALVGVNAVRVAAMQAPGLTATNIWLLPDPAAAAAMPEGHTWPAALTAAQGASSSSSVFVTAKVADFGLALSLDPKDTHAAMAARVSSHATMHNCCYISACMCFT
jgi:hypothetical protein